MQLTAPRAQDKQPSPTPSLVERPADPFGLSPNRLAGSCLPWDHKMQTQCASACVPAGIGTSDPQLVRRSVHLEDNTTHPKFYTAFGRGMPAVRHMTVDPLTKQLGAGSPLSRFTLTQPGQAQQPPAVIDRLSQSLFEAKVCVLCDCAKCVHAC